METEETLIPAPVLASSVLLSLWAFLSFLVALQILVHASLALGWLVSAVSERVQKRRKHAGRQSGIPVQGQRH